MKILKQKGNVLLFAIVAMTAISVLGTGIYFMTTSAIFSGLGANDQNRAYQLALAGKDYALMKIFMNTAGQDFTFINGDKFHLVINGDMITSTGIVKEGTPYEAKRTITITKSGFSSQAGVTAEEVSAEASIIQPTGAPSDFISKTDSSLSLGKIGVSYQSKFGAVVYSGDAAQGNCVEGECEFGIGFNAFFVFQFASGSTGDGFTFDFFNGSNNNATSVGGYAGSGELMGYAGDSYVSPGYYLDGQGGRGIQPPKVAVEFDPYRNAGIGCFSGRNDEVKNHMALVFWGDNTTSCTSTVGKYTFDDNQHSAGTGGTEDPQNSKPTSDACSYFNGVNLCGGGTLTWPSNWLLNAPDNVYAFRIEVTRSLTPVGGPYAYRIKTWIKKCGSGDSVCSAYNDSSNFANAKISYTDSIPTLDRTIQLSETHHQAFNTILFGWTTATGGATQNILINRFKINFKYE